MSDPASIITRVVAEHAHEWRWKPGIGDYVACTGCAWEAEESGDHNAHVGEVAAQALSDAGIALVVLPEPRVTQSGDRVWDVTDSWVILNGRHNRLDAELNYEDGDDAPLEPEDARRIATALLAGAKWAEQAR